MTIKLIRSAAYFQVCPECGQHGIIVTADGKGSDDISTVEDALKLASELNVWGKISEEEMPELTRQIIESEFPKDMNTDRHVFVTEDFSDVSAFLCDIAASVRAKAEEWNTRHRDGRSNEAMGRFPDSSQGKPWIH